MKNLRLAIIMIAGWLLSTSSLRAQTITFVQANWGIPTSGATVSVAYTGAQVAGDLNVVAIGWQNTAVTISTVTDTKGNVYAKAVGPTKLNGTGTASVYYAKNIKAAAANANTVKVTLSATAPYPDVRILEYAGADQSNPVDVTAANTGSGGTSNSGSASTGSATDLIFGANYVSDSTTQPGSGFTERILTSPDGDIAEDKMVTSTGSYSATAPVSSGGWVMQMVAFRTPGGGGGLPLSGPIDISNQNGTVVQGVHITSTSGPCLQINGSSNITVKNVEIGPCGDNNTTHESNGLEIANSDHVYVYDSYIHVNNAASGCCDSHDGILVTGGSYVTIQGNVMAYNESNIEVTAFGTYPPSNNITIIGNYLLNPRGPYPRGQQIQTTGGDLSQDRVMPNVDIENNYTFSCTLAGTGGAVKCPTGGPTYLYSEVQEDAINASWMNGFTLNNNYIVGGHSATGCGYTSDGTASPDMPFNGQITNNILSNTGQCGLGIAGGINQTISGNKILNLNPIHGGGNQAVYVGDTWDSPIPPCSQISVTNNTFTEVVSPGVYNSYGDNGTCATITYSGNVIDAAAYNALNPMSTTNPPPMIPPTPKNCVAPSPYTNNTSLAKCY